MGAAGLGFGLSPYGISPSHAAPADLGLSAEVVDHGIAAVERNVRTGAAGITHKGIPLLYLISDGNPVSFNVLNGDTGELIGSFPLPPKSIGVYPTVTPDGVAYFAVRGYGKVAQTTDSYAWGFEKVGNALCVGTGIGEGHAVKVDIESGEKTELTLPKEYDEQLTYCYWFCQVGDLIAMAFSPGIEDGTNVLFWDTVAQEWVLDGAIPTFLSLNGPITAPTEDGRFFLRLRW